MNFEQEYAKIKSLVSDELSKIEDELRDFSCGEERLQKSLIQLITSPSKRIRPILNLLYLKMFGAEITKKQVLIQSAVELIHNATLIHDDVIDCSDTRRNQKTLNAEFGNNLAVVFGDFLLTIAIQKLLKVQDSEILDIFNNSLTNLCKGELNQYVKKFKIPTIEEYIEKCKNKTAELFMAGLLSSVKIADLNQEKARIFSELFGIAFQMRDDLLNVIQTTSDKPVNSDIKDGIYNAPVIFAGNLENIEYGIEKTKELLDNYIEDIKNVLKELPNNEYNSALIDLAEILKV
ncbi:MAG: polyprenyl synthetase family protein [Candidatus Gastranaerophilaceae bacterium]